MPGDIGENVTDPRTLSERPNSGKPETGALALMRAIRAADLRPPGCKLVAFTLATHGDRDGTSIRPSLATLADQTGIDVRSVRRHVRALREAGILIPTATPDGKPTVYRMALTPDSGVRGDNATPRTKSTLTPDSGVRDPGLRSPPTCTDLNRPVAPTGSAGEGQPAGADDEPVWLRIQKRTLAR